MGMRRYGRSFGWSCTGLLGVLALGCGSSGAKGRLDAGVTSTPSAGGTGAFGVVTVNGTQKMYLPQPFTPAADGNASVAVVDVGVAGQGVKGAPALITTIDLGTTDDVTATGGDSSVIIGVSTDNPRIYFIDPATDTVEKSITLDATYGTSSFSGGGGYVTGVAVDSPNGRAYLSVWNGFAVVDLGSRTITKTIQVPPSENFGFDSVNQRLLAPFYDCVESESPSDEPPSFCGSYTDEAGNPMTDGLNVVDLTDDTVYTYQDPAVADASATQSTATPVGLEPDSAAADPSTQKVVVPSEGTGLQYILDLSMAVFDKTKKAVTAPHVTIDGTGADELTGVAIEPTSHLAFFESEGGTDMGVADLTAATAPMSTYVHAYLPTLPDGSGWSNIRDPHGIAVTTGAAGGHPIGFLVRDDYHWVARIDLATFLALPSTADTSDVSQLDVADASSAVTYLDATTKR